MRSAEGRALAALALLAMLSGGCAGDGRNAEHPTGRLDEGTGPKVARPDALPTAEAEIGAMSEYDVGETFRQAQRGIVRCLEQASREKAYLAGDVEVTLRIAKGGRVIDAFPSRSTLGDREAERCIVALLAGRTWPSPVGGKVGIARQEFSIAARGRTATALDATRYPKTLASARGRLASCGTGALDVTLYLDPDGKVLGAGAATKDPAMAKELDCAAAALGELSFPSPGSWNGKLTIRR